MRILAIETSCDETAMALVEAAGDRRCPRFRVLSNTVSSQIAVHRPFGGIVPGLAKREHIKNLPIVLKKTVTSKCRMEDIDLIAVTIGPGLEPALWTGITFAKDLAKKYKKPLLGVNHLEGHLYSFLLSLEKESGISKLFPAMALIVSGGHTILAYQKDLTNWKKIGETRDDAVGEVYDKVARLIGLPYPGGPEIEKLALRQAQGKHPRGTIEFPRPMIHQKNYDFSFSGLKTAVLYYLRDNRRVRKADIAASFQQAVIDVLITKTDRAARESEVKSIILSGGVAANKLLRSSLRKGSRKRGIEFFVSEIKYSTDNAAMIAAAAYFNHLKAHKYRLTAQANLSL